MIDGETAVLASPTSQRCTAGSPTTRVQLDDHVPAG